MSSRHHQFQEGHPPQLDPSEWNQYNDPMKQSTASVSSFQSWASADPSQSYGQGYSQPPYQQQQPYSQTSSHLPPQRGAPNPPRNRSNSNNSNAGYGYNNHTGSHMSHMSHASHMSNNSQSFGHHPYQQGQAQGYSQQQQHQYQPYQDGPYQPSNTMAPSDSMDYHPQGSGGPQHNMDYPPEHHPSEHPEAMPSHQQQSLRQHRPTPSDASFTSYNRAQHDPPTPQSLMQSMDHIHQQGSPRMAARAAAKRRDPAPEGAELPSLDQYEAMLQKMASPSLGPAGAREPRNVSRRSEIDPQGRADRQARLARKQQQQQQLQQQQQQQQQRLVPQLDLPIEKGQTSSRLTPGSSAEDRRLKRRSSLPTMTDVPSRVLTDLKRRSSGHASPKESDSLRIQAPPTNGYGAEQQGNTSRHSWENDAVAPREDLLMASNSGHPMHGRMSPHSDHSLSKHQYGPSKQRQILHAEDDDDSRSIHSEDSDRLRLEQQRKNKRNSPRLSQLGAKPPLAAKSQLRLSHTLSQSDVDEVARLQVPETVNGKMDDSDRQIEQFQLELQQLQSGITSSPRVQHSSPKAPGSTRSRATTPLGMVTEENAPAPNAPTRQQLLASLDDGSGQPHRSTTPTSSRSRPTTPIGGIRPPPGPAPSTPSMSGSVSGGSPQLTSASPIMPRKSSPVSTRRSVKPSPPVSSAIMLQPSSQTRPRAGSVASVSSMASFTMEASLHQAPPSSPLPSLPPPPTKGHRARKSSGSNKDMVMPSSQLIFESSQQETLPTPAMTPELEYASLTPSSNHPAQIARLKKRVSTLEKELEAVEGQLSSRIKDGDELQDKVDRLVKERDELQTKLALLQEGPKQVGAGTGEVASSERASLQMKHDQEMQDAVKQVQNEKDLMFEALMERQDRSRSEMNSEMESLKMQLIEKEDRITRLQMEQQEHVQSAHGGSSGLEGVRSQLERELSDARQEIQRLLALVSEKERTVQALESKVEKLQLGSREGAHDTSLEKEVQALRTHNLEKQEAFAALERDLDAFTARSQQEEAQYRTLQDTVQRLTSKLSRMESQHSSEIQQIQRDHEELLDKVVFEHANTLTDLSEQSKTESESRIHRWREESEKEALKERKEAVAREKLLQARLEEQGAKNEKLERELYRLEQAQQAHDGQAEDWVRTNKSLQRQLAMDQLQQQESLYRMEEMEKENKRLKAILSDLDIAARLARREDDDEEEDEEMKSVYEAQRKKWLEQAELMKRKMAKTDEEASFIVQKNMELMVALEMAQSS